MVRLIQIYYRLPKEDWHTLPDLGLIYLVLLQNAENATFIKCWRINIHIDEDEVNGSRVWDSGSIWSVWIKKSFSRYKHDNPNAPMNFLDDVHEAFLLLCEKREWDKQVFEDIKNTIIKNNFIFYIPLLKPKIKSVNKQKLCAQLVVLPLPGKYEYYVRFFKDGNLVCDVLIYEGGETFLYWKVLFNSCKWISKNEFYVFSKEKSLTFKCFFEECRFELINQATNEEENRLFEFWNYHTNDKKRMELSNIDEFHLKLLSGEGL